MWKKNYKELKINYSNKPENIKEEVSNVFHKNGVSSISVSYFILD
jgi:hypothetical protein